KGMKCLDAGCGGGHVTLLMASMVGPEGKVTARTQMNRLHGMDQSAIKDRHLHRARLAG
ncbi:MAG: hypothetical protein DME68_03880, partial [Verrucomicrobia bacterium]